MNRGFKKNNPRRNWTKILSGGNFVGVWNQASLARLKKAKIAYPKNFRAQIRPRKIHAGPIGPIVRRHGILVWCPIDQ
jgi:hypothetical protein